MLFAGMIRSSTCLCFFLHFSRNHCSSDSEERVREGLIGSAVVPVPSAGVGTALSFSLESQSFEAKSSCVSLFLD